MEIGNKKGLRAGAGKPPTTECPLRISDHALLRYLERFEGLDAAGARERLAQRLQAGRARELLEFAQEASFKLQVDGATFCGRKSRLLTCYPAGRAPTA